MRLPWQRTKAAPGAFQAPLPEPLPEPTAAEQQRTLDAMRDALRPVIVTEKLPADFGLQPGTRLRRSFGNCRFQHGRPPLISVRCTTGEGTWRARGAIMLTMLHELAHLKYRGHGPRFWALLRRMVAQATTHGLYHAEDDDATEPAQGNAKLAGSPAHARAVVASEAKRQRAAASRQATRAWAVGDIAVVSTDRGPLSGCTVTVLKVGRTRVIAALADGHRYSIPATLLERPPLG